jgi:hypothetical protein
MIVCDEHLLSRGWQYLAIKTIYAFRYVIVLCFVYDSEISRPYRDNMLSIMGKVVYELVSMSVGSWCHHGEARSE